MSTNSPTAPSIKAPRLADGRNTRGEDRRELLLQTTLKLIAERGIAAVNHRSVAEAADVPLGSTTYWFRSRQQMLSESLEHFVREEIAQLNQRLAGVLAEEPSEQRLADEIVALVMAQLGEDRWRAIAQYTLLQEAIRQPELEAVCRDWTAAWDDALAGVFSRLGVTSPKLEAQMFLAMLDGLILGQLATPAGDPEASLIRPAVESWFARLPRGTETSNEGNKR